MTEQPDVASVEAKKPSPTAASGIVKIVTGLLALVALVVFGRHVGGYLLGFARWVESQGALGPVIFTGGYAAGTLIAAPGAVLTMLGGAIFGLGWGTLWVFCAATLGSSAAFLIARYVARGLVESKLAGHEKFAAIDKAVGEHGFKIVFLLRLTPVFPFSLGNYALGLTRVRFSDYLLASIGTLPGTFLYVYYGKAISDIAALAAGHVEVDQGLERWIFLGLGLAATVAVTAIITRIARCALSQQSDAAGPGERDTPATAGAA